jgi:hypothetical protein
VSLGVERPIAAVDGGLGLAFDLVFDGCLLWKEFNGGRHDLAARHPHAETGILLAHIRNASRLRRAPWQRQSGPT